METDYNSDGAAERVEQINELLLLIYEKGCRGIEGDHPLIGNLLNLSSYILFYFQEMERKDS